jgi:hypothetical protein
MLALVVEARHWTRVRWEFDDEVCGRVWQFSSIGIALAAVLIWLDGSRYTALPSLLSWLPALLLPMQFVQSYGLRDALPMSAFSYLARRRRKRNERLGLIEETTRFNFGNAMFATTLVAASVGSKSFSWLFLPGLVILSGWMLMSAGRSRPLVLFPALTVAGLLALGGWLALERAEEWLGNAGGYQRGRFDPNFVSTLIGTAGAIQQSADIVWRLQPGGKTAPPPLLRTGTFNTFLGANWQNQRVAASDFKDLDTRLIGGAAYYLLQESERAGNPEGLPYFNLRGAAAAESPLPLPGDANMLRDFELDGIDRNTFGTVRVFPKNPVIDGRVFWKGGTNPESPPLPREDLRIPIAEREVIRNTLEKLGMRRETDLRNRLALLRTWFHKDFRYTRNPTIQHSPYRITGPTAITRFLTQTRAGHCEYFATAAILMLREAGVPARYATGYAVMERDMKRGTFVIRGTHAHAWCRVWDEGSGRWIDFDPTPPDWFSTISGRPPLMQRLNDDLKRLREDFFLWRNRPANRLAVSLVMLGAGIAVAGFIAKRLWRSKRRLESRIRAGGYAGAVIRTPLHDLESRARKRLGERPPGQPFARWLDRLRPSLPDTLALDEAIALHQRLRFDPAPPKPADRERLARLARELEAAMKRSKLSGE